MKFFGLASVVCLILNTVVTLGAEHRIEVLKEPAPADAMSGEIHKLIAPTGFKVIRGASRTVCEIWLCKELKTQPGFKATPELLYPFKPGQLIGVLRFKRKGSEFRDQSLDRGVYTLRFGLQPIDGNHEGTSPTRDFLMMVKAERDKSPKPMDLKKLLEASAESADSSHPAMLCLQRPDSSAKRPSARHMEEHDWWVAELNGNVMVDGKTKKLPMALIVAGYANE